MESIAYICHCQRRPYLRCCDWRENTGHPAATMPWQVQRKTGVLMRRKPASRCLTFVALSFLLIACSHTEPLETSSVSIPPPKIAPVTDQAIIAEAVGNAPAGVSKLAWANPATGSAGVIERIKTESSGVEGCRQFITSQQSIEGATRFDGVACPSDGSWKISGTPGLH